MSNIATSVKNLRSNRATIQVSFVKSLDDLFSFDFSSTSEFIDALEEVKGQILSQGFILVGEDDKLLTRIFFTLKARFPSIKISQAILFPNTDITPNAKLRVLV